MKLSILAMTLVLIGCNKHTPGECDWSNDQLAYKADKPTILVIGDSISLGYTPLLAQILKDYNVVHSPCNPHDSNTEVDSIGEWLDYDSKFAAVVFNSGLHDVHYGTTDTAYETNLRNLGKAIKARTPNGVFVLSTAIPPGGTDYGNPERVVELNTIATSVMNDLGIPVMDLYSVSMSIPDEHKDPGNVHYTDAGYQVLVNAIVSDLFNLFGIR